MKLLLILILAICGCEQKELKEVIKDQKKQELSKRYSVTLVDPPIIFNDVVLMNGQMDQWPSLFVQKKNGDIYIDDNVNDVPERKLKLGLGPSFKFHKLDNTQDENKEWFDKGSIRVLYEDNYVKAELNPLMTKDFSSSLSIKYPKDIIDCNITQKEGLSCQVDCTGIRKPNCPVKKVWHDEKNSIIEVNTNSYPGIYAITKNGTLIHFEREFSRISETQIINKNIKFRKNSDERYFLNAYSDDICMQSDDLDIYCSNEFYESFNSVKPNLEKVIHLDFKVEQVSFSAFHYCFLSDSGEVFCMGDNSCGQITGRHDQERIFKKPEKIDFLQDLAKKIFVYQGGTCALLVNGNVQCFGLGASVIRSRLLPEEKYWYSYSWLHGFRPWQICGGGAENGV